MSIHLIDKSTPSIIKFDKLYDSFEEFLHKLETSPRNPSLTYVASESGDKNFTETKSFKEAIDIARHGWEKGSSVITKLTKEYNDAFIKLFPQQDWSTQLTPEVAGEVVNIEAVVTHQPETMFHFDADYEKIQKLQNGKMQRIIINTTFNCHINPDTIFNRGSIVASMINIMELAGFRTELWGVTSIKTYNHSEQINIYVKIKDFHHDLFLPNLAFIACHPSMLRRLVFAEIEQCQHKQIGPHYVYNGYGKTTDLNDEEIHNFCNADPQHKLMYGNVYFESLANNKTFKELLDETTTKIKEHFTAIKI